MTDAPSIPKDALVPTLVAEWQALDDLLAGLDAEAWARPTALPGWTVQDVVAHVVGTESMLAGDAAPEVDRDVAGLAHVANEIGAANERWVEGWRGAAPESVLAAFREIVARRTATLAAMSQDELDAPSWTPAGHATYGRFMQIRIFDCWLHEQDIRDAVGQPGHEDGPCAEASVDEIVRALGYIVGKRGGAPDGATVTIELTGPVRRTLHVAVAGRAALVPELPGPATATIRMPSSLFVRLAGGRVDPADHLGEVQVEGDEALGRQIAGRLAFTI